jgi:hypothetical protein
MKKINIMLVTVAIVFVMAGCSWITFEGPGGSDINQDAQDAQFDFNHNMLSHTNAPAISTNVVSSTIKK